MNKQAKQKLWRELSKVSAAATKQFKPRNYLEANHPKVAKAIIKRFGSSGIESITRYLAPDLVVECGTCGGPTKWSGTLRAFAPYCSLKCSNNSPEVKARKIEANLKEFGTPHAAQSDKAQAKARKTNRAKYGVDHALQSPSVQAKVRATNIARTGHATPFQNPASMTKARETMIERYGVECASQSPVVRDRAKATMIERYGAANPSQVPELRAKVLASMRKKFGVEYLMQRPDLFVRTQKAAFKTYDMQVGRHTLTLQGYEDMAVNSLLSIGVPKKAVMASTQSFNYGKRVYHPDFEVAHKSQRLVVEVKSGFTSGLNSTGTLLPDVLTKAKAVIRAGKPILILVMRPLEKSDVGYDRGAPKGKRKGRVMHFVFSTPKRPDWKVHSNKAAKKELKQRLHAWLNS